MLSRKYSIFIALLVVVLVVYLGVRFYKPKGEVGEATLTVKQEPAKTKFKDSTVAFKKYLDKLVQLWDSEKEIAGLDSELVLMYFRKAAYVNHHPYSEESLLGREAKGQTLCLIGWWEVGESVMKFLEQTSLIVVTFQSFPVTPLQALFQKIAESTFPGRYFPFTSCDLEHDYHCTPSFEVTRKSQLKTDFECNVVLINEALISLNEVHNEVISGQAQVKAVRATIDGVIFTGAPKHLNEEQQIHLQNEIDFVKNALRFIGPRSNCATNIIVTNTQTRDYYQKLYNKAEACCQQNIAWASCERSFASFHTVERGNQSIMERIEFGHGAPSSVLCKGNWVRLPKVVCKNTPYSIATTPPVTLPDLAPFLDIHCFTFNQANYIKKLQHPEQFQNINATNFSAFTYFFNVSFLHKQNNGLDQLSIEDMDSVWTGLCDTGAQIEIDPSETLRKEEIMKLYDSLPRNNVNWGVLPFTSWPPLIPDEEPGFSISSADNFELGLCVVIRNEVFYLEEWLRYHLSLGFDKIVIENHYSVDNLEELIFDLNHEIEKYEQEQESKGIHLKNAKKIVLLKWEELGDNYHKNAMKSCWTHIETHFPKVKWVGMWDADEFLVLNSARDNLKTYIHSISVAQPGVACINFRWKQFSTGAHFHTPSERSQIRTFLHSCQNTNFSIYSKPICRPDHIEELFFHGHWIEKFKVGKSALIVDATLRHGHWLFHYMQRSFENFFLKTSRKNGIFRNLFPWALISEQEANCNGTDLTILYERFYLRRKAIIDLKHVFDEWIAPIPMTDSNFIDFVPPEARAIAAAMWGIIH